MSECVSTADAVPLNTRQLTTTNPETDSDEATFTCLPVAAAEEQTLDALVGATKSPASSSRSKSVEL